MTLEEYALTIRADLVLWYCDVDGNWMAKLDRCEVKDGSGLRSICGHGPTPVVAYCGLIDQLHDAAVNNQPLVRDAGDSARRQTFGIPKTIEPAPWAAL